MVVSNYQRHRGRVVGWALRLENNAYAREVWVALLDLQLQLRRDLSVLSRLSKIAVSGEEYHAILDRSKGQPWKGEAE
jgi:hypothetical protein